MALCVDYRNPQLKLPGFVPYFSKGVERLIEIVEEEKTKYIRESGRIISDNF